MREDESQSNAEMPKKPKLSKDEKIAKERLSLEAALDSQRLDSVRERIAYILNNYPSARNSDKKLALLYWRLFEGASFSPDLQDQIFKLTHVPTLTRERAKIQNDFRLFLAKPEVQRRRGVKQEESFETYAPGDEIEQRVVVYADENGKSGEVMSVGGVWFLDPDRYFEVYQALLSYKKENRVKGELKFAGLSRYDCSIAYGYLKKFLVARSFTSFKIIWVRQSDLRRDVESALYGLYRHFMLEGAMSEVGSGRIALPRRIELQKDSDDGSDIINLKDMETQLVKDLNGRFGNQLLLTSVYSVNSAAHDVMQAVDLIVGSFGRVFNRSGGSTRNHKDDFAESVLQLIGVSPEEMVPQEGNDWVQIKKLE